MSRYGEKLEQSPGNCESSTVIYITIIWRMQGVEVEERRALLRYYQSNSAQIPLLVPYALSFQYGSDLTTTLPTGISQSSDCRNIPFWKIDI